MLGFTCRSRTSSTRPHCLPMIQTCRASTRARQRLGPLDLAAVGVPEADVPRVQFALQEGRSPSGLLEAALPPVLHITVVAPNAARLRRQLVNAPLLEFLPGRPGLGIPFHRKASVLPGSLVLAEAAGLPEDAHPRGLPDDGLPLLAPQGRRLGSLGAGLDLDQGDASGDGSHLDFACRSFSYRARKIVVRPKAFGRPSLQAARGPPFPEKTWLAAAF